MNATIRTANRLVFLLGALLSGVLVTGWGYRVTIGAAVIAFAADALVVAFSPSRSARHTTTG